MKHQAKQMLDQLSYAVAHFKGRTTITQLDLDVIKWLIENQKGDDDGTSNSLSN